MKTIDAIIRIITPKEKEMREKFPKLYKQVDRLNELIKNTETEKLDRLSKINLRFSRYLYKHNTQSNYLEFISYDFSYDEIISFINLINY